MYVVSLGFSKSLKDNFEGRDRQFFKTAKSGNVIYDENARARNGLMTTPSHSISALCTTLHRRNNSGLQPLVLNVQR